MLESNLIELLNTELETQFPVTLNKEDIIIPLSEYINHLINTDFQRLLYLLYRIDISEQKLQKLLKESPHKNAGDIIADLIVERQLQKIESREKFKNNKSTSDEEQW